MDIAERFANKIIAIPEAGCWIWIGQLTGAGYGMFRLFKKANGLYRQILAHRFAYEYFVGPTSDKCVLHRCDTPCCVNPHHLVLGTHKENMQDANAKGRSAFAKKKGIFATSFQRFSKCNHSEILASSEPNHVLAKRFGVDPSTISKARTKGRKHEIASTKPNTSSALLGLEVRQV